MMNVTITAPNRLRNLPDDEGINAVGSFSECCRSGEESI
jgi:hypothetical protein